MVKKKVRQNYTTSLEDLVIYFKDVHLQNNFDLGVGNVERGDKICCRGARVNIGDIDEMVSIHMSSVSS